jgi:hypothetical protein
MIALVPMLVLAVASLIITRVATLALAATGLSYDVARFQARSALSGVGYTTSESEMIATHPVRRRIVSTLMVLGRAEIVTGAGALVLSFVDARGGQAVASRGAVLAVGLAVLAIAVRTRVVNRPLSAAIAWGLRRWTDLDVRDYVTLLGLSGNYAVVEVRAEPNGWLAGRELSELDLPAEGVLVLGLTRRDGTYLGAPTGRTRVDPHDTLILYGHAEELAALARRLAGAAGDAAHRASAAVQSRRSGSHDTRSPVPIPPKPRRR